MKRVLLVLSLLAWFGASRASADIALPCTSMKDAVFDAEHGGCVAKSKSMDPATAAYFAGLEALTKDPKKAFPLFERSCTGNYGAACTKLAYLYETGRGRAVTKDPAKARALFRQACEHGDAPGCQRTGNFVIGTEPLEARKWFERGCKGNNGSACAQLAFMIDQGMGGDADPKRAATQYAKAWKLLERTCPKDGNACLARAMMFQKGYGTTLDLDKAMASFAQACEAGVSDGCTQLAFMLESKPGREADSLAYWRKGCVYDHAGACSIAARALVVADRNSKDARDLAERACELDTTQCEILAKIYDFGMAGLAKPDRAHATGLFRSLCDAGDRGNCVALAARTRAGIGITANADAADKLLEDACAADEPSGCAALAQQFTSNKKDDAHGFVIAQKGCNLGNAHACYVAGWMTRYNRRGTPKAEDAVTSVDALPWFERGCDAERPSPHACLEAAQIHDKGLGKAADKVAAAVRYKKACDVEEDVQSAACVALGTMALEGTGGVKKDPLESLRLVARGCAHGATDACVWLPTHAKTPEEIALVSAGLAPACASGEHDDVCFQLAFTLFNGGGSDRRTSFDIMTKLCGKKDAHGCFLVGLSVYNGWGTLQDKARAEALQKQLCDEPPNSEADHPWEGAACFEITRMYLEQKKDNQLVLQYAELACKFGNGDACSTVAFLHYTAAKGVTWSATIAAEFYKKGCDKGSAMSCANSAELYRYGIAGPRDPAAAAKLYKQVCENQSSAYACTGYGHYLAAGEGGVAKDLAAAEKIFRAACKDDIGEGCIELAELLAAGKRGSAAEIAELRNQGFSITARNADDNPEYMWRMGVFYRDGVIKPKDLAKAREWFAKSCDRFDPLGCLDAGRSFQELDREKARVYFASACGSKVQEACDAEKLLAVPAPGAIAPGKVHAKGCGGCATTSDGALALVGVLGLVLTRRRPRSRAGSSRDRAPASRA